jgi:hypothetical protein
LKTVAFDAVANAVLAAISETIGLTNGPTDRVE